MWSHRGGHWTGRPELRSRRLLLPALLVLVVILASLATDATSLSQLRAGAHPQGKTPLVPWDPLIGAPALGVPRYQVTTTHLAPAYSPPYVSGSPTWLAYVSTDQSMWVASPPSSVDIVASNSNPFGNVSLILPVGSDPFGVSVDGARGEVFVTNTGSNNVSVISDTGHQSVGSIGVGQEPMGIAFDATTGETYVADEGSNSVAVISDATLRVVASVAVGFSPIGVAFDPTTGAVFVTNFGSYSVSVIDGASHAVVATVPAGIGPYGVAVDSATDNVYVTNQGSENVTVINARTDSIVATIPVVTSEPTLLQLQGIAYDSRTGQLWVGAGSWYLIVLNASAESVAYVYTTDPSGVAYDPDTGAVCATNSANATFECYLLATPLTNTVPVTFTETGLPSGTPWNISARGGPTLLADSAQAVFYVVEDTNSGPFGTAYTFLLPSAHGYVALDPHPTANVTTSPVSISVSFRLGPAEYAVRFNESGLATGVGWNVAVNDTRQESTGGSITFYESNGSYGYSLGSVPTYVPPTSPSTLAVRGASVSVMIPFTGGPSTGGPSSSPLWTSSYFWLALVIGGAGVVCLAAIAIHRRHRPPATPASADR
jgi:YVTN family beta-propeller protein